MGQLNELGKAKTKARRLCNEGSNSYPNNINIILKYCIRPHSLSSLPMPIL